MLNLKEIPAGEEIVIAGFSGKFPKANNIAELSDHLYNHVDMISERPSITHPELPKRLGQLSNPDKFDAAFFNISDEEAEFMDPGGRILLEKTFEALLDAGMNPVELNGTDTRVYLGVTYSETDRTWFQNGNGERGIGLVGSSRAIMASRISHWLNLRGPTIDVDTACSSGLYALELAYRDLRMGHCDYAIVTASNLCLTDATTLQFYKLGLLSQDGKCKTFDDSANGYVRSEAVTSMIVTRARLARRVYAEIVHVKTNCDGYKPQGITYPSGEKQKLLLTEFYQELDMDPTSIPYIEAHGTGTKVGDYEESGALCEIFCKNRGSSLPVGSIKTNLGHTEASSGLCSIYKMILCFEKALIPANLHYKTPRKEIPGLHSGLFHVVTENTPFDEDYTALSGFGFGGANCHVLLKRNGKLKMDGGVPTDDIPRLVGISARNVETIRGIIDDLLSRPLDAEYVSLYHHIFAKEIPNHPYRSYVILQKNEPHVLDTKIYQFRPTKPRKIWFVINNAVEITMEVVQTLMEIPSFSSTIGGYNQYLKPFQTDVLKSLNSTSVLGSIALQMGIVDLLKGMGINLDYAVGGDVVAAYAEGNLTDHEAILTAYFLNYNQSVVTRRKNGNFIILDTNANECCKIYSPNGNDQTGLNNTFHAFKKVNDRVFNKMESNTIIITLAPIKRTKEFLNGYVSNSLGFVSFNQHRIQDLLSEFGKLFLMGLNPNFAQLYPKVQYPVSRTTPSISSLIKWNHLKSYLVQTDIVATFKEACEKDVFISVQSTHYESITGHVIDGRNLYPATGYLHLVWDLFSEMEGALGGILPVVFEDVKFLRATNVPASGILHLDISIRRGTGNFEICEEDSLVVIGRIKQISEKRFNLLDLGPSTVEPLPITSKDIYKELRLRGYNYQGKFQSILATNVANTVGEILWDECNDWTAFMDNMLQMALLQEDSRFLFVPTGIKRLTIDPTNHRSCVHAFSESLSSITVVNHTEMGLLKGGGVEIQGLQATSINRRKSNAETVLEQQEFVPYIAKTSILQKCDALRVLLQLALQENPSVLLKIIEISEDENETEEMPKLENYLSWDMLEVLNNLPLIQSQMVILTRETIEDLPKNITCVDQPISKESDAYIVVGHNLINHGFEDITKSLKNESSFIISRETVPVEHIVGFDVLAIVSTESENFVMLRKAVAEKEPQEIIKITDDVDFMWLSSVQDALATGKRILLYAQGEPLNGIVGFVNCLQKETNGGNVQGVFIDDPKAPLFDLMDPFYITQLKKNLKMNVYRNGNWGSFKHLKIQDTRIESECACAALKTRGDLSSFQWIERPLQFGSGHRVMDVYYVALNFRDVMTATGKLSTDSILNLNRHECIPPNVVQGFEFAGRDVVTGKRYMGICPRGAIANRVTSNLFWEIPDAWTMEDAATVPVVYCTIYYGLVMNGLTAGKSVLIHAGTGGIGLSAINLCLSYGCEVFTTVGTSEKREFIKELFPQIDDNHIGNSRDTSFEQMVMNATDGRGVDFVLNSLAEEKLTASIRCLAKYGKFIEIGKYDLANDNKLGMELFLRGASFHGVMLDASISHNDDILVTLKSSINQDLRNGIIKPIHRQVFHRDEIEQAFRFMASGKHLGKVLLKMRDEEPEMIVRPSKLTIPAAVRLYCNVDKSTVIVGGLGGFGLELCSWLIQRGCRHLILSSRSGVKNGYQRMRIKKWKAAGINVTISTEDVATRNGCLRLLQNSNEPIESIYNLAAVLNDAVIENQKVETFQTSFQGKALATRHLDEVSRIVCPELKYFVVFSSVVCGRGNAGQTNYGMANAVMERICEQRCADGLPAVAIQWGAIGEVGLVADMQESDKLLDIGGTLQQSLTSCFETLDILLNQEYPVVGSMVVAEKKRYGFGAGGNLAEAIFNILGVRDINTISPQSTLAELGMDSMMAVEIKQTFEREYDLFFTPTDIRNLTFAKLMDIQNRKTTDTDDGKTPFDETLYQRLMAGYEAEKIWNTDYNELILKLNSLETTTGLSRPPLFIIPGIDGQLEIFKPISSQLEQSVYGVQFGFRSFQSTTEMTEVIINEIRPLLCATSKQFCLLAYSFGCIIAMEIALRLQAEGFTGRCLFIDGAPAVSKLLVFESLKLKIDDEINKIESIILSQFIGLFSAGNSQLLMTNLASLPDLEARLGVCESLLSKETSSERVRTSLTAVVGRCKFMLNYQIPPEKSFHGQIRLIRPTKLIVNGISDDYELSKICANPDDVTIEILEGDHYNVINNNEMSNIINKFFLQ